MVNSNYGKLTDGELSFAPNPTSVDGRQLYTNDPAMLLAHGYKPVCITQPEREEGYDYIQTWTETEDAITAVWTAHKTERQQYIEGLEDEILNLNYELVLAENGLAE